MTDQQLKLHNAGLVSIVTSPAYIAVRNWFEETASQEAIHSDLDSLGKAYIREKAIKDVFRTFEFFSTGVLKSSSLVEDATLLEPESLDDDGALDLLND